jgi:hypothetical protein
MDGLVEIDTKIVENMTFKVSPFLGPSASFLLKWRY